MKSQHSENLEAMEDQVFWPPEKSTKTCQRWHLMDRIRMSFLALSLLLFSCYGWAHCCQGRSPFHSQSSINGADLESFDAANALGVVAVNETTLEHKHHKGHVLYQATLKKNNEIEYSREFTAPCDYGVLIFNVGPAKDFEPYLYDVYQDAYVHSNNEKLCLLYPYYRAIQKGPFPFWVTGDPTSFSVPTGHMLTKISSRIVRPRGSKNFTAAKGGDFLIMAKHNFYTVAFYEKLKDSIHQWSETDEWDLDSLFADYEY
eukprot:Nitzschia sp. Nitz4//scaffold247_size31676//4405//5181//NITZ4_007925-RA/size31676-processed-gene-0.32-mRNA-1//1//CDS//3329543940//5567//frame0